MNGKKPTGEPAGTAAEKARLRARFRAERAALSPEDWEAASAAVIDRLLALPEVARARTLHVFWPLAARREVDTRPLVAALAARGVRVALPVVASAPGEPPHLEQRLYTGSEGLRPGLWGLEEPTGPLVAPSSLDALIVPALAAARDGHRLGYGAGFYDRFLMGVRATIVCPVFASALVDRLPTGPYDRPVDVVVTEYEALYVGSRPVETP
ncbi:MAG TPA: 5-formyltetrahydrofolate cyclo-ligase [Rhodothermales bacterium]|nr:5-formyltetrahydrofolate cyclo-ligase [Rhodothermales bacterium]